MFGKKKPVDTITIVDDGATLVETVNEGNPKNSKPAKEKAKKAKVTKGKGEKGAKVQAEDKENEPPLVEKKSKKDKIAKDDKKTAKSKKEKLAKHDSKAANSENSKDETENDERNDPKKRDSIGWGITKRVARSAAMHTAGVVFTAGIANVAVAAYDVIDAALFVVRYLSAGI
jgi:hypothetical protein